MALLVAIVASFIPFIALFLWLRNHIKEGPEYKALCNKTLVRGFLSVIPIVLLSAVFHIGLRLGGFQNLNPLLYQALYTFVVLAFAEELVKFLTFRRVFKKVDFHYSWLDVTVIMTIVGIGFLIVWFLHGLYDFSLSAEFQGINDNLAIIPLALAALDIVLVFRLVHFVRKSLREQGKYTEPFER